MLGYFLTNVGQDTLDIWSAAGKPPWRRIGLCWKGEYRKKPEAERERGRTCVQVCMREREKQPRILFRHHWQGSETTARSEVISVIKKLLCLVLYHEKIVVQLN